MNKWQWISASKRGTSHERNNTGCQDAFKCVEARYGRIVAVVADGAGSASHGRYGAAITCRRIVARARTNGKLPDHNMFAEWIDELRDELATLAKRRGLTMRDFACTLVFAMADTKALFTAHVGDGAIVSRFEDSDSWECVSWPENGEYASTTFFVTDNIGVRLRSQNIRRRVAALALFSDGIERLVLDFSNQTAPANFFNTMSSTLRQQIGSGFHPTLSRELKSYLGSEPINSRTDDDKTLVVAIRQ